MISSEKVILIILTTSFNLVRENLTDFLVKFSKVLEVVCAKNIDWREQISENLRNPFFEEYLTIPLPHLWYLRVIAHGTAN